GDSMARGDLTFPALEQAVSTSPVRPNRSKIRDIRYMRLSGYHKGVPRAECRTRPHDGSGHNASWGRREFRISSLFHSSFSMVGAWHPCCCLSAPRVVATDRTSKSRG